MRPDQMDKLDAIVERLADVFLVEADPVNWSGCDKLPSEMTKDERGNRHWDRKGAVGTAAVLNHAINVSRHYRERAALTPAFEAAEEAELDKTIRKAEQRAESIAAAAVQKAKQRREKAGGGRA